MQQNQSFPPIIGVEILSVLLGKKVSSILADRSRAPHKIPPSCSPPGCKSPRWIFTEVVDWVKQFRAQTVAPDATPPAPRRRGAPTIAERIARKKATGRSA